MFVTTREMDTQMTNGSSLFMLGKKGGHTHTQQKVHVILKSAIFSDLFLITITSEIH